MDRQQFERGELTRAAAGIARRWVAGACAGAWLIAAGALAALAAGPAAAADLVFPAGEQAGGAGTLAIGDSLRVGAAGLAPGAAADLRLRDPSGAVVAERRMRADDRGEIPLDLLWRRTGVVGCDCRASLRPGPPEWTRFDEAERALSGTRWTIELAAGDGVTVLARRTLTLEPTRGFQVYASDASGCPRSRFAPEEDVYLTFRGPQPPSSARIFLVADRPTWDEPLPLLETRAGIPPRGEVIEGIAGPQSTHLVWPADSKGLRSGYFAIVVRADAEDDRPVLLPTDQLISHRPPGGGGRSTEEGVRINDWDCGPPRH